MSSQRVFRQKQVYKHCLHMYSNWVCLYAENRILLQIHVSKSGRDLARLATPLFHLMHM